MQVGVQDLFKGQHLCSGSGHTHTHMHSFPRYRECRVGGVVVLLASRLHMFLDLSGQVSSTTYKTIV